MHTQSIPLVSVTRGGLVECVHRGHVAVVDDGGRLLRSAGDPRHLTYARSSAKLLQAIPVVASGAVDRYGLDAREIALLCASHSGEEAHVEAVYRILGKLGIGEDALLCGAHPPYHKPSANALRRAGVSPKAVHNNCSGKHAGMLTLAKHLGATLHDYKSPDHPVQRAMLASYAAFAGVPAASVALGVDGCGVPVYGAPLSALALAYARLAAPTGAAPEADARRTVVEAVRAHPEMLAGTDRYDTALIRVTNGRVVGKMGAEGVFAVAAPGEGLGLAVKIEDGAQRALYPAVTEALLQLGWIDAAAGAELAEYHTPAIRNWGGDVVGAVLPSFRLE
ncbi:asparaginase [Paenibacillus antri]|uniref:Asparaginase n=1 Tax=Paenibacillus antri TaxID=2582848 RepID=A0A5R9GEW2_9BACL|nr:asparaginase [Paenibacillus antri]TLS49935.1 asparaginase [Paenibacillus antri]